MNRERWIAIKEAFAQACEMDPPRRHEFLSALDEEDPDAAVTVRELLANAGSAQGFLEPPEPHQLERPMGRLPRDFSGYMLGEFELVREIGRGASGVVYLGRQPALDRNVAIKILAPWFSISDERRARFEREARTASLVRHPNVVSVLSFGEQNGVCYIVMEFVAGRTLHAHLADVRSGQPTGSIDLTEPREAARIVEAVVRGLEACHRAGVIHRDVKPHNVLIDEQLEPRVVDFGLAKHQAMASLSDPGSLSGTPQYMSPEQARAQGDTVDHRSDIYSAGAVLYELLALRPPVEGTDTAHVLRAIADGRPRHLRVVAPAVPRPLAMICMRALSKDVGSRYQTAGELAADLQRFRAGRPILMNLRWAVRDRLSTVLHDHPWTIPVGAALLLLGLEPGAESRIDAADTDLMHRGVPESGSPADVDPSEEGNAGEDRIQELMDLLPGEPIQHDEDG